MQVIYRLVVCVVAAFVSSMACASPQALDRLEYGGKKYAIHQSPMSGAWHEGEGEPPAGKFRRPTFDFRSFNNWGGYTASWGIRDKKLYLNHIEGRIDGKDVQNEAVLPKKRFPVVARWFTGKIHVSVGGYNQDTEEHEAIVVFEIDKGIVKSMSFVPSGKIVATWDGL